MFLEVRTKSPDQVIEHYRAFETREDAVAWIADQLWASNKQRVLLEDKGFQIERLNAELVEMRKAFAILGLSFVLFIVGLVVVGVSIYFMV